jgi:hypothetical protein
MKICVAMPQFNLAEAKARVCELVQKAMLGEVRLRQLAS